MLEKYKGGFIVKAKNRINDTEWIFDKENSNENRLIFLAYDANLLTLPPLSTWQNKGFKQKQINKALEVTKDFKGEVWLDDVKIKEVEE